MIWIIQPPIQTFYFTLPPSKRDRMRFGVFQECIYFFQDTPLRLAA